MTHAHLQSLTPNASFYVLRYVRSLDMNGDPVQAFDQAQSKSGVESISQKSPHLDLIVTGTSPLCGSSWPWSNSLQLDARPLRHIHDGTQRLVHDVIYPAGNWELLAITS